jgi:uncharacterized oxidoreductase
MRLTNNTILITGGTSGIGYELGKRLLKLGNTVILLGRNEEKLNAAQQQGFEVIRCDLAKQDDIEAASVLIQNRFPSLNMLFNNAGVQFNYDFADSLTPLHSIEQEIAINVTGQMMLTQLLIPHLSTQEGATIINTTSGLGAFPKSNALVYSASKAAMRNFTQGLRFSLKEKGIDVMEFMPPVTATEMTAGRAENMMTTKALVDAILPQLRKGKRLLTIPKMRIFLWIAFFFPSVANAILSK